MSGKSKRKKKRILLPVLLGIILITTIAAVKIIWFKPFTINQFYERALLKVALADPQLMSTLSILDPYGLDYYNKEFTDPSYEASMKRSDLLVDELKTLRSFDRSTQTKEQLMSTDIMDWYLDNTIEGMKFFYNGYTLNQYSGAQDGIVQFMCNSHVITCKGDAEDYIKRLEKFGGFFDILIENMKAAEKNGVIPPTFIVKDTIEEMENFIAGFAASNSLYTNLEDKVFGLGLDGKSRNALLLKAEKVMNEVVYPAYQRLIDYYKDLLPRTHEYAGVWSQTNGDAYYANRIKTITTLDISPEDLYRMIDKRVTELKDQLGALPADEKAPPRTPAYYQLDNSRKFIDDMTSKLGALVNTLPKTGVVVDYYVTDDSGMCSYFPSNIGSPEPAVINLTRSFSGYDAFTAKTVLCHEGVPGHHLQFATARELQNVPTFRKVIPFTAFTEGWADYAQYLPWEYGLTYDKGWQEDEIRAEILYVGRCMIDIGINYKRWTREEAKAFAVTNGICDGPNADYVIDYCTVNPGYELSYAVGSIKIRELRDYAMQQLGDRFDIREFNDEVLKNGAIPLEILDRNIKAYVAAKADGLK